MDLDFLNLNCYTHVHTAVVLNLLCLPDGSTILQVGGGLCCPSADLSECEYDCVVYT